MCEIWKYIFIANDHPEKLKLVTMVPTTAETVTIKVAPPPAPAIEKIVLA